MSWFKRIKDGITTRTQEKKEVPEGIWHQCPSCKKAIAVKDHVECLYTCPDCNHHDRINSRQYFEILFDEQEFDLHFNNIRTLDVLDFNDRKSYKNRLDEAYKNSGLDEAIQIASGNLNNIPVVIGCMDFTFIGGSMGSVVGEKIAKAVDLAIKNSAPLVLISKSGGARMMESTFSLMQMVKTTAKLTQLSQAQLPYISLMTDPTTGGVSASYAMLGDLNIAEPGALIGFAGPRVIQETIKKELPEGFQRAESLLEHGFLDFIVHRKDLKSKLSDVLEMLMCYKK